MKELRIGIEELKHLSDEDVELQICNRVVEMYCRIGDIDSALTWKWRRIEKLTAQI